MRFLTMAFIAGATIILEGQDAPVTVRPEFEVASVRLNTAGSGSIRVGVQPGGRFEAINIPVMQLIQNAYQLLGFQIIGGPSWLSDRYDVVAKAETEFPPMRPGTAGALQLMLQSLLADRFALKAHRETRELDIYALVRVRPDGPQGPRLRASDLDCEALRSTGAVPRTRTQTQTPGMRGVPPYGMRGEPGNLVASAAKLIVLTGSLSGMTRRIVEDRTGLMVPSILI